MCHSGSISQIIKPMEKEWHLDSRFLLLFFFPFLSIFFPAQCSLPYTVWPHAPRLFISILQRNRLWCTSLLALPDHLILSHAVFHTVWDFPFCSGLSFVSPHSPLFVPVGAALWTDELERRTGPADKNLKKAQVSGQSFPMSESLQFYPKLS